MDLSLLQASAGDKPLHWWEVVTGILAIPAAIIGLRYSYQLTRKTRLEITKTELEIEEKQRSLGLSTPPEAPVELQSPNRGGSTITNLLILRFIILYTFSMLWDAVGGIFRSALYAIAFAVYEVAGLQDKFSKLIENKTAVYGAAFVTGIPNYLFWIFSLALAWPLFKDVNPALGLKFSDYLPSRKNLSLRGWRTDTDDHSRK